VDIIFVGANFSLPVFPQANLPGIKDGFLNGGTAYRSNPIQRDGKMKPNNTSLPLREVKSPKITIGAKRLVDFPLIRPEMNNRIGSNINGPSLIRVPEWVMHPLGKYYLYFADHKGDSIRLAYADQLEGPWRIHTPGALKLEESHFLTTEPNMPQETPSWLGLPGIASLDTVKEKLKVPRAPHVPSIWEDLTRPHIASPDVHVLDDLKEIRMYYHGLDEFGRQITRVASSEDGISFVAQKEPVVDRSYLRILRYKGAFYGLAMPGVFYRSMDGKTKFERGPELFNPNMRHSALLVINDVLLVFWTQVCDAPERILFSTVNIRDDWGEWHESPSEELIRPEYPWEGADRPVEPSVRSSINTSVNQLRDPAIFQEDDRVFLLYTIAGESGIAISELFIKLF